MHCIIGCLVDKDKDRGSCYRGFGFIVRELLFEEEEPRLPWKIIEWLMQHVVDDPAVFFFNSKNFVLNGFTRFFSSTSLGNIWNITQALNGLQVNYFYHLFLGISFIISRGQSAFNYLTSRGTLETAKASFLINKYFSIFILLQKQFRIHEQFLYLDSWPNSR